MTPNVEQTLYIHSTTIFMNWFRPSPSLSQPDSSQPIVADLAQIEQTIAQDRVSNGPHQDPVESTQDADYPTDDAITQAFNELTAPPIPPTPKPPTKTQVKTFVKIRPWLFLPLLGVFPAIALTIDRLHPPQAASIAPSMTQPTAPPISSGSSGQLGLFNSLKPPTPLPANPLPIQTPVALTIATPAALMPIDLSKLTPAEKALNAQAKAAFEATNAPVDAYVEMHVSIAKGSAIAFASNTAINVTNEQGKKISTLSASDVHTAQPSGNGVSIGSANLPAAVFLEPEPGGLLYLNNRPYRGKLLLAQDSGQLHAINYINLRHYLYSVVASEVSPSWNVEAIKAQAVAARSYALTYYFKPAGKTLFHLGSDEYYQVYSGTQKEDDRSNQAVDATAGEYVSYKGGVVESLYAASDDIVAEAFAGKGMSQLGAKNLAEHGYKYDRILANYYPTTKLGKIAKDE